jgi:hypothetical protein
VLTEAAGYNIKIISKIESQAGLQHYDSILDVSFWAHWWNAGMLLWSLLLGAVQQGMLVWLLLV